MEIDNELIKQWELKVHSFANNVSIKGMEHDDIEQELKIAIIKAAQHFDESKGVSFHTYLHVVMTNTIRSLMKQAKKLPNTSDIELYNSDNFEYNSTDEIIYVPFNLDEEEKKVVKLLLQGYSKRKIKETFKVPYRFEKIMMGLKEKMKYLKERE